MSKLIVTLSLAGLLFGLAPAAVGAGESCCLRTTCQCAQEQCCQGAECGCEGDCCQHDQCQCQQACSCQK